MEVATAFGLGFIFLLLIIVVFSIISKPPPINHVLIAPVFRMYSTNSQNQPQITYGNDEFTFWGVLILTGAVIIFLLWLTIHDIITEKRRNSK
jgi:hypothetical protein